MLDPTDTTPSGHAACIWDMLPCHDGSSHLQAWDLINWLQSRCWLLSLNLNTLYTKNKAGLSLDQACVAWYQHQPFNDCQIETLIHFIHHPQYNVGLRHRTPTACVFLPKITGMSHHSSYKEKHQQALIAFPTQGWIATLYSQVLVWVNVATRSIKISHHTPKYPSPPLRNGVCVQRRHTLSSSSCWAETGASNCCARRLQTSWPAVPVIGSMYAWLTGLSCQTKVQCD